MIHIEINREYFDDRTEGRFFIDLYEFRTLELPRLDNQKNISCIPVGKYICSRNTTGKHQYYSVNDVNGRTYIEWHPVSIVNQLQGCIAPCFDIKGGQTVHSEEAAEIMLNLIGDNDFSLEIK